MKDKISWFKLTLIIDFNRHNFTSIHAIPKCLSFKGKLYIVKSLSFRRSWSFSCLIGVMNSMAAAYLIRL